MRPRSVRILRWMVTGRLTGLELFVPGRWPLRLLLLRVLLVEELLEEGRRERGEQKECDHDAE